VARLAGLDAKLDALTDLLKRHDGHLVGHDERLRHLEKQMNVAFGWAGAVGFVVSVAWSWIWGKLHGN
jgi:hypothetical protein